MRIPNELFQVKARRPQLCLVSVQTGIGRTEFVTEKAIKENVIWENWKGAIAKVELQTKNGNRIIGLEAIMDDRACFLGFRRPLGYTSVEVVLEVPKGKNTDEYRDEAITEAANILRTFLLGYRMYSADHLIPDLRIEDIPVVEVRTGTVAEGKKWDYQAKFTDARPRLRWEKTERIFKDPLPQESMKDFAQWLEDGMKLQPHNHLLLIATERAHVYNDYASAVIFAQSALEVFLSDFIRRRANMAGITELPMKDRLPKPLIEALEDAQIKHKLQKFIPQVTGSVIAGTPEYNNWNAHAYELRNEIIHTGRINISLEEAEKAFDSVVALINKIAVFP